MERVRDITNITSAREGLKKTDRSEGKRERKRYTELMNASLFSSQINKASSCLSENARERERERQKAHSVKKKKNMGIQKNIEVGTTE